jgi:alkylated DNA nucleotide flippase Atl1
LGLKPSDTEVAEWRYGPTGKKMTQNEQLALLESALKGSTSEWRLKVLSLIQKIEPGQLISYGNLARWANKEYGLDIVPRNAAWLRKQIYWKIGHDTDIPLHRVANDGDLKSSRDHPVTQHINKHKRSAEGSLYNPVWLRK